MGNHQRKRDSIIPSCFLQEHRLHSNIPGDEGL
jgi:hypothetical protein